MTVCVYALTARAARVSATGMSGERLRLVREGPLAAIVGEVSRVPTPSPARLRRYDRTVRLLSVRLPAVVPARFGTCFDDPDELRFVLRSRRAALRTAVAHVRNRVQMTVRVMEQAGRGRRPHPPQRDGDPGGAGPCAGAGTVYLRTRAEHAARAREVPGFDPVRRAVRRWVRDERVEKRTPVTTIYHLVPRASAGAYRRALDRALAGAGLRVIVTGPWPAYAFADGW